MVVDLLVKNKATTLLVEANLITACGCMQRVWVPYPAPDRVWLGDGPASCEFVRAATKGYDMGPIDVYHEVRRAAPLV